MPDSITLLKGEKRPLHVTATASSGTITFAGTPTFLLVQPGGPPVPGFTQPVAVSGQSAGPAASLQAFYTLDTGGLTPGAYVGLFSLTMAGSDGVTRTQEMRLDITVQDPAARPDSGPDFTDWPTAVDVALRLTSAGITPRSDSVLSARLAAIRAAVITEVAQRTQRQFVAGAEETRLYDGTGTAEQEVDEMVSLTGVSIVGIQSSPGYSLSDVRLTAEQGKPQTRITVARGSVPAFTSQGVFAPYQWLFPAGRQNVAVTGRFGYAAQIPPDLWEAACGEMAVRLAREAMFSVAGRLSERRAGDELERYALPEADALDWHREFEAKMGGGPAGYRRPAGRRLRNLRNRMVC